MARNSIKPPQYEAAYKLGLRMHDEESFGIAAAKRELIALGLNPNSAADFVYNVSHLLKGECYKRVLSLKAAEDYLTWIRRDRGRQAWTNAITALDKHIYYRENDSPSKSPQPGLRKVLERHRALLAVPEETSILLRWNEKESADFVDVLPLSWFTTAGDKSGVIHLVLGPSNSRYQAKCNVRLDRLTVDLDYEPFAQFNERHSMDLGVARLHFADEDRTAIQRLEWKPRGSSEFAPCPFDGKPDFKVPPAPPYVPPAGPDEKVARMIRERPGQAAFRKELKAVYRLRCCMTGCTVPEALEGAHIDPYQSKASDNVRNGLLLRRDIHALFDKHLIAIEPGSHVLHVGATLRADADYAKLHGLTLKLPPEPSHHPDPGALRRRWIGFNRVA